MKFREVPEPVYLKSIIPGLLSLIYSGGCSRPEFLTIDETQVEISLALARVHKLIHMCIEIQSQRRQALAFLGAFPAYRLTIKSRGRIAMRPRSSGLDYRSNL